jgi:ABC-type Fe3+/spermidine/putrescine transport system ATPase subunit
VTRGAIVIDDVVKIYDPDGTAVMAVDHCSLEIKAGEICMIVGPSGCGKTTLLNAIAGFHEITSGRILLDGEVLCSTEKPKAEPGSDPHRRVPERRAFSVEIQSRQCRLRPAHAGQAQQVRRRPKKRAA